jgi:hypothetical protein
MKRKDFAYLQSGIGGLPETFEAIGECDENLPKVTPEAQAPAEVVEAVAEPVADAPADAVEVVRPAEAPAEEKKSISTDGGESSSAKDLLPPKSRKTAKGGGK